MTSHATYYDGINREGFPARVTLTGSGLRISYSGGSNAPTVEWNAGKIESNDFDESRQVFLKYGNSPTQYLELKDPAFIRELKASFPDARFHKPARGFVFSSAFMLLLAFTVVIIGLVLLSYFLLLPKAAERIAMTVPIEWEKQLGDASYKSMVAESKIDTLRSNRLNQFFSKLGYKSNYTIDITVVDEEVVNAFALPGGRMVVYKGIIDKMDNYKEMVALLSHEFSHIELKHTTKNMFRSLSSYMLISVLLGDASGLTAVVVQNADQLKQLGYSRSLEEEADRNGLKLMRERRIDPKGMEGLFRALKQEEGEAGKVPEFLSTHPLTDSRIKMVKEEIAEEIAKNQAVITEDSGLDSLFRQMKQGSW